jgi:hypothetical protein
MNGYAMLRLIPDELLDKKLARANAPSTDGLIAEVRDRVMQVVAGARAAGQKVEAAWFTAGETLGLSQRRVRAYYADDVTSLSAVEYLTIGQRWARWLEADAIRHETRAAELRALIKERRG